MHQVGFDWTAAGWVAFGSVLTINAVLTVLVLVALWFLWRAFGGLATHAGRALADSGKRALDARLGPPGYRPPPDGYPQYDEWAKLNDVDPSEDLDLAIPLRAPKVPSNVGQTPRPRDEEPLS